MSATTVQQLEFLSRVVTEKPLNPILANIYIDNGMIQVSDGKITAGAMSDDPQLGELEVIVPASKFIKAYTLNRDELNISFNKRLVIKRGSLKVQMVPGGKLDQYPAVAAPEHSNVIDNGEQLIDAFTTLLPFIGEAGRTALWSCGIMLDGKYAYATNNTTLIRYDLPLPIETPIIVPVYTVGVIVKNNDVFPTFLDVSDNQIIFGYDTAWLSSPMIDEQWPETIPDMLAFDLGDEFELQQTLRDDVKALSVFCEDSATQVISLTEKGLSTVEGNTSAEVESEQVGRGNYRAGHITRTLKNATHADLFSQPARFKGDCFVGVMVGLK